MAANVQAFALTNGIIMSSAMFTNHFAVPGFVRKCRAKFPEVFLSLFDVFLFQDKLSRNFNHIAGFGFELLLKKGGQINFSDEAYTL